MIPTCKDCGEPFRREHRVTSDGPSIRWLHADNNCPFETLRVDSVVPPEPQWRPSDK